MDEPAAVELVGFEQVQAAPGTALLRIAARPTPGVSAGPLTLVIDDGASAHRHVQLPALPGAPDLIRVAFSAPLEHVRRGVTFSLELSDGTLLRLPAPSRRRPIRPPRAAGVGAAGGDTASAELAASRLADAERRAESRRLALGELERRLQAERQRRQEVEAEVARLLHERAQAVAERDGAVVERDEAIADRDQAEGRARALAATAGGLEAHLRAQTDSAQRVEDALRARLADAEAEAERFRAAAELAQERAHTGRLQAIALDEQLAHAQAQVTVLELALEQRRSDAEVEVEVGRLRELEAAVVELEGTLAARAAEIELLRDAVESARAEPGAQEPPREGEQLRLALEAAGLERLAVAQAEIDLLRAEVLARRQDGAVAALVERLADERARAQARIDILGELPL